MNHHLGKYCVWSRVGAVILPTMIFLSSSEPVWGQFITEPQVVPQSRVQQQRGTALGGIAGAVVGGIIGDNNGEAGAGAAIGGLVGAVTGGVLGNAADKEQALANQQQLAAQQQQLLQTSQSAITPAEVVSLSRSGVSENIIINQIQQRGISAPLQTADIIALHQQGVSESVITVFQQTPLATARLQQAAPPRTTTTQQPVIIQERVVVPRYVHPPRVVYPRYQRPSYHYRGRSGIHIRF